MRVREPGFRLVRLPPNAPDCAAVDDAYLDRVLIGGRERREIVIAAYDPAWPERFAAERERIAAALGDRALRIEHIGSTSVPGLAAKPIVDILVEVASLDGVDLEPRGLRPARARGRAPHVPHAGARRPRARLAVRARRTSRAHLAFRDRLRASPEDRAAYEALKRELADARLAGHEPLRRRRRAR